MINGNDMRHGIPEEEIIKTLRGARALIEKGWTRGVSVRHEGTKNVRYCLLGAIETAAGGNWPVAHDAQLTLHPALKRYHTWSIPHFNDEVAKTKKDVLKVIDETIERLESQ